MLASSHRASTISKWDAEDPDVIRLCSIATSIVTELSLLDLLVGSAKLIVYLPQSGGGHADFLEPTL